MPIGIRVKCEDPTSSTEKSMKLALVNDQTKTFHRDKF